ncbi:iron-containing redox enzyme family protein, partial [Acinetobacter sp. ANC 5033]|nr:iron-containing redox enzyme family protein [Acinetobacter amyesii]
MPTAVKERILHLITKDHQKYYEIVEFFLDASIPNSAKELKAFKVLENEIITLEHIDEMPNEIDHLVDWIHHNNRT